MQNENCSVASGMSHLLTLGLVMIVMNKDQPIGCMMTVDR